MSLDAISASTRAKLAKAAEQLRAGQFVAVCKQQRLPAPEREHEFHPTRKWRFDFAWPDVKLALEVEGGIWTRGRHTRGQGALDDMSKYNAAALLGWRVLRTTPDGLDNLDTITMLRSALSSTTITPQRTA